MLEVARRLTPGATLLAGEAEALPLPDASIDLAFSTISFHHWRDQEAGVREIARVLRPEGYFLLADLSYPDWLTPAFRTLRFHSPAQLRGIFERAGLRVRAQRALAWRVAQATAGEKK
jgi:ubiquinone/menaquinone biosynthesis C-methylase UbiE